MAKKTLSLVSSQNQNRKAKVKSYFNPKSDLLCTSDDIAGMLQIVRLLWPTEKLTARSLGFVEVCQ